MKVFISWSKDISKQCAELLKDLIKCTIQSTEPWISSQDIDKGTLWFREINDQLKETKIGIVCLTKENKNNPWILFESGALAKGLSTNKVCTFLIDLSPADIESPLAQFNHTLPDREGLKSLLETINKELGEKTLEDRILNKAFDAYWPQFKKDFKEIIANIGDTDVDKPIRTSDEILKEVLYTTRTLDKRIRSLEYSKTKYKYHEWSDQSLFDYLGCSDSLICDQYEIAPQSDICEQDIISLLSEHIPANKIHVEKMKNGKYILIVPSCREMKEELIRKAIEMQENQIRKVIEKISIKS